MRRSSILSSWTLAVLALSPSLGWGQSMPGFQVTNYATVPDPVRISVASNGDLYVGRDLSGSGGTNAAATFVSRVSVGGMTVTPLGNTAIPDPDVSFFDELGTYTGVPGSVLVGSTISNLGRISQIAPDGTVTTLHTGTTWRNPSDFVVDSTGRLLFPDGTTISGALDGVWYLSDTGPPVALFTAPNRSTNYLAVDAQDRFYVGYLSGEIELRDANGALLNASFATLPESAPLEVGRGGDFGTDLYVGRSSGDLGRFDAAGNYAVVGTGFSRPSALRFGPDGALYVAEFGGDRISRITRAHADLQLSVSDSPDPAPIASTFVWSLVVRNAGPDGAELVTLNLAAPDGAVARIDATAASQGNCQALSCDLGTLASGATATVTLTLTGLAAGTATTAVQLGTAALDPAPGDNQALLSTTVGDPIVPDAGFEEDAQALPDAAEDGGSPPNPDATVDGGADASFADAAPPVDSGIDGGVDSGARDAAVSLDVGPGDVKSDDGCNCQDTDSPRWPWTILLGAGLILWRRRRA